MNNLITTDWLNLRSEPVIAKGNVLSVMPPDNVVQVMEDGQRSNGWLKIRSLFGNTLLEGFASGAFLAETTRAFEEEADITEIPVVHLPIRGNRLIIRNSIDGRAFPLNEPGMVFQPLDNLASPTERITAIHNVVEFLNVEKSARYSPSTKNTFCNIYAYDVAYCLGAYIPRVWWNSFAIAKILKKEAVEVIYEKTVRELNANSLCDWFEKYGTSFRWKRFFHISSFQEAVNRGNIGIIVAQKINLNISGHIVAVVPEIPGISANRQGDKVLSPLQSQAGRVNKKYFTGNNWWENQASFRKFGFWVKELG